MLVSITWLEYSVIILFALALYYIVIAVLYYKDKFSTTSSVKVGEKQENKLSNISIQVNEHEKEPDIFFQNPIKDNTLEESKLINEAELRSTSNQFSQLEFSTSHQQNTPAIEETDNTLHQVQNLIAGVKEAVATAVEKDYIKEEFVLALKTLLKKYHFVNSTSYLVLINNLIESECEKYGYIQLSAEEQVMLWNE